jgi:serine/threonine-protein kinase
LSDPSPEIVPAGTVIAGRYRVERQLGQGGMGSVYLVQHVHTDQQLALKLLHAAVVSDEVALTRFRREARATAKVDSDHVVKVTDADVAPELGGVPFLVMEWLRGQSLEEIVSRAGTLPPDEVVLYLRQAARALDKAHAVGIVHRDLKPDNLFLTRREDDTPLLKILDFGIAKLTQSSEDPQRLKATGTGQVFGTPLYMSPEQIKAELDKICPQTDVWALGVIAHRLLLGAEPWSATTITALVAQIAYEPLPVPSKKGSTLGPEFDAWFAKCCGREPGDRFASASQAVSALARALDVEDDAPAASRASVDSSASSKRRIRRGDEMAATAFSATSPIPLASVRQKPDSVHLPTRSPGVSRTAVVGAIVVVAAASVATFAYFRRGEATAPPPAAFATQDPPPANATATSVRVDISVRASTSTIVAPADPTETAAAPAAAAPSTTPQAALTTPPRAAGVAPQGARKPPPSPVPQAAPQPAPAPPPTAAPVATTPKKPEDPLGSRY